LYVLNKSSHSVFTVCMYLQFVCIYRLYVFTVCMYLQFVCIYSLYVQFVCTVCMYSLYLFTVCMYYSLYVLNKSSHSVFTVSLGEKIYLSIFANTWKSTEIQSSYWHCSVCLRNFLFFFKIGRLSPLFSDDFSFTTSCT
jgi:hypothetical protein